jgi:hypothetical protein
MNVNLAVLIYEIVYKYHGTLRATYGCPRFSKNTDLMYGNLWKVVAKELKNQGLDDYDIERAKFGYYGGINLYRNGYVCMNNAYINSQWSIELLFQC